MISTTRVYVRLPNKIFSTIHRSSIDPLLVQQPLIISRIVNPSKWDERVDRWLNQQESVSLLKVLSFAKESSRRCRRINRYKKQFLRHVSGGCTLLSPVDRDLVKRINARSRSRTTYFCRSLLVKRTCLTCTRAMHFNSCQPWKNHRPAEEETSMSIDFFFFSLRRCSESRQGHTFSFTCIFIQSKDENHFCCQVCIKKKLVQYLFILYSLCWTDVR